MNKKRIVCYGDSNTWGANIEQGGARYEDDARWTCVLQQELGEAFSVIEEGLCGRTTVFSDPLTEGLNGKETLCPILMSHNPIDLLIFMLGTNDCKARFSATATNIVQGLSILIRNAKKMEAWRAAPNILVIAPVVIGSGVYSSSVAGEMGPLSAEKAAQLPELIRIAAAENGCAFMDCNDYVKPNQIDFMHIDAESQPVFGKAVANKIKVIFN